MIQNLQYLQILRFEHFEIMPFRCTLAKNCGFPTEDDDYPAPHPHPVLIRVKGPTNQPPLMEKNDNKNMSLRTGLRITGCLVYEEQVL